MGLKASTAADYKKALIDLTPKGACWPTHDDSNYVKLLDAFAAEWARVDGRVGDLFDEAFPDTATELLANWESQVGLPDAYSDPNATIAERRAAVLFKLQARGGQSASYIVGLVNALGYRAFINDLLTTDVSMAGDYSLDDSWLHYFLIVIEGPITNEANLEARINSIKPAHSGAVFYYVEPSDADKAAIEALIASLGITAEVIEAASAVVGVMLSGGILFDDLWDDWYLVIAENPVSDHAGFEAAVLALQPKAVFHYVDDLTDY